MSVEKSFNVEIITPDKMRYANPAQVLSLPGSEGQLAILPGHAPLLALLDPGHLMLRSAGKEVHMAVGAGFVKMHDNRAVCLVEFADLAEELDAGALEKEIQAMQGESSSCNTAEEREELRLRLKVARARLGVARRKDSG